MGRLLWLPAVLRAAGLTVHEVPGWQTRGLPDMGTILGVTCHATAGSRTATTQGEINVLINGSNTAPPPIAQTLLERRTGDWYVVASGLCYHSKVGWGGPNAQLGNKNLVGVEAMNDNRGEPWAPAMLDSYQRGVAAILAHTGRPASRAAAHWEHQPGNKTDPVGINMTAFRARVAQLIANPEEGEVTKEELYEWLMDAPITQAVDVPIDGIPGGTITRPLRWWLSAPYAHIVSGNKGDADRDTELAAALAEIRAEIGEIPGADPAVWAERVAQLLVPHLPPGADPQAYLDALHARLAS